MNSMFCQYCGAKNVSSNRFCENCGQQISTPDGPPQNQPYQPVQSQSGPYQPAQPQSGTYQPYQPQQQGQQGSSMSGSYDAVPGTQYPYHPQKRGGMSPAVKALLIIFFLVLPAIFFAIFFGVFWWMW